MKARYKALSVLIDDHKRVIRMAVKLAYGPNLRYTLGIEAHVRFGDYTDASITRLANLIGVPGESLNYLLHNGGVSKENFESICHFLNPSKGLKAHWYTSYCLPMEERMLFNLWETGGISESDYYLRRDALFGNNKLLLGG